MRLVILNAVDVLERGFLSSPPDRMGPSGQPTSAVYATNRALLRVLGLKAPDLALAVIDDTAPPAGWDPRLVPQLEPLVAMLEAHGFRLWTSPQPADLVASTVSEAVAGGHDVVVLGSDKRLAQLVSDKVWWYDAFKRMRYTPETVLKRFGVPPAQVADWLGLVGDKHHLDGVKGIGAKGAVELLERYGTARAAFAALEDIEGRTGNALRAGRDAAVEQLALAHLRSDLALPGPLDDQTWRVPSAEQLNRLYAELGFHELLVENDRLESVQVCVDPDQAHRILGALDRGTVHAIWEDPSPVRGDWVGLAVLGDGVRAWFPGDPLPALKAWLEDPARSKTGHDTKQVTVALARRGVKLRGIQGDTNLASHLADPSGSAPHELGPVAQKRLGRPVRPEETMRGRGKARKRWSELPPQAVGSYACHLAETIDLLWHHFEPEVHRGRLDESLALCDTLVRMELHGMRVDGDDLQSAGADFAAIRDELEAEIYALAGREFNIGSTKQLGTVLFEELGLPCHHRTKTGYSTANHALERIAGEHPVIALVIRWRTLKRLQDTWVTALRKAIGPDGRVHSSFHPARSFTGRLVNSHPDLGRVPGRTPELRRIRQAFVAPAGKVLLSADYDQLGLYVLAHLTQDPNLVGPLRDRADMHSATAAAVLGVPVSAIDPAQRALGKVVNFATFASQGPSALRLQLGVDIDEARLMIDRFFVRYAVTQIYFETQLEQCRERGGVTTLAGRWWPIADVRSNDAMMRGYGERLAKRASHEGSVADVVRRGLLRADEALVEAGLETSPLVQILDEIVFEVAESEVDAAIAAIVPAMQTAYELVVPLQVHVRIGATWAEIDEQEKT